MSLETIKSNVRSLHASYGFEKRAKELLEMLVKEVIDLQEKVLELEKAAEGKQVASR